MHVCVFVCERSHARVCVCDRAKPGCNVSFDEWNAHMCPVESEQALAKRDKRERNKGTAEYRRLQTRRSSLHSDERPGSAVGKTRYHSEM